MVAFSLYPVANRLVNIGKGGWRIGIWSAVGMFEYIKHWATVINIFKELAQEVGLALFIAIGCGDKKATDINIQFMENILTVFTYVLGLEAIAAYCGDLIKENNLLTIWYSRFPKFNTALTYYTDPTNPLNDDIDQFMEDLQFYFELAIPTAMIELCSKEPWRIMDGMMGDMISLLWRSHHMEPDIFLQKLMSQYSTLAKNKDPIYASKRLWLLLNPLLIIAIPFLNSLILSFMAYRIAIDGTRIPLRGMDDDPTETKRLIAEQKAEEARQKLVEYMARQAAHPETERHTLTCWNRYVKLEVWDEKTGELITLENGTLDVYFEIKAGDYGVPNSARIQIYNLTDTTSDRIKRGMRLRVIAGYERDYDSIFVGEIERITSRWQGADRETTIMAYDDQFGRMSMEQYILAINKGVVGEQGMPIRPVVKMLMELGGVPVGYIGETDAMILPGNKWEGTPLLLIRQLVEYMNMNYKSNLGVEGKELDYSEGMNQEGLWWFYIEEGRGYFVPVTYARETVITLRGDSGLLSIEYSDEDNTGTVAAATSMLNHHVKRDVVVNLISKTLNNERIEPYRIGSYTHICTDTDFYTRMRLNRK